MASPGESTQNKEKDQKAATSVELPKYPTFEYQTHKEIKGQKADTVEYLSAWEKVTPEEKQKSLEQAKEWEKKGDLDLLRAAGLSLDQIKKNPLERHVRLSSMYLKREENPQHLSFRIDTKGNEMAQWDLDLADMLPPNIISVDVLDAQGKVLMTGATRGFADGKPGYFDPKTKERLVVQDGHLIVVKETQSSVAMKEKRLGPQTYENSFKEEVYTVDNAKKTVLKDEIRKQAEKQNVEVKTDKTFFDTILSDLTKSIDPKFWENFQKDFQLNLGGIEKQITGLIASLGFAKIDSSIDQTAASPTAFDQDKMSKIKDGTESKNTPAIGRDWLLANVGRNNEQVQRFMVNINFMGANLRVNKLIAPYLIEAQERAKSAGIDFHCKQQQCSCQNWRPITGGTAQSMHSWGVAVDLNSIENPYQPELNGSKHQGKMRANIPPEFVNIMKNVGFRWGGEWSGPADPMHFELAVNPYQNRAVLQSAAAQQSAGNYLA